MRRRNRRHILDEGARDRYNRRRIGIQNILYGVYHKLLMMVVLSIIGMIGYFRADKRRVVCSIAIHKRGAPHRERRE